MSIESAVLPGLVVTDHRFEAPLDHGDPDGETISIFAREVVAKKKAKDDLPCLVYFQGGPGFPSPRPERGAGWLKTALDRYRVVFLDQRGVGRSTPINHQSLLRRGSAEDQARYLMRFRADSIVRDAELVRKALAGEDKKWTGLGQSYGGFCLLTYMSIAPEGLDGALFAGGLPSLHRHPDEVYRATYQRVADRNRRYYKRFPQDVEKIQAIVRYLDEHDVRLPSGGRLTPRRLQQLGMLLGFSTGIEKVHYLLEDVFIDGVNGKEFNYASLRAIENSLHFDTNPIFAILHESIYCQGFASSWSAERVREEYPEFEIRDGEPVYFTGEMVYSWMFDEYPTLKPVKEAAELIAAYEDWPALYDAERLKKNEVPAAAAVYYDDMFVECRFSDETARHVDNLRIWVTNEYEHDGLGGGGEKVLGRLLKMMDGEI